MLNEVRAGSATFAITPEHYQLEPAARYRDVTEDQAAVAFANARHDCEIATLKGSRLAFATETEEGKGWAEARLKKLTGGERLPARWMHGNPFNFDPTFKLLVIGNHEPELRTVDAAIRRRFRVIEFKHKPANVDPLLEDKLRSEAPGILRWMINGALDWQSEGLIMPKSVRLATDDYLAGQDTFGNWLNECCESGPALRESGGKLRESWEAFAKSNGDDRGSAKGFAAKLKKRHYDLKRESDARYVLGLRLKVANDA
jgi:putative DNA primase/helicase